MKGDGKSNLEAAFLTHWRQLARDLPEPEHNALFCPGRRWQADFLWREAHVIVEVEGKTWGPLVRCHVCGAQVRKQAANGRWYAVREAGGRHVRGRGFENDVEKYNAAVGLGYKLFRVTKKMLDQDPYSFIMMVRDVVEYQLSIREVVRNG